MGRMRTYSSKDMEKILKENGYELLRTRGSHRIYSNGVHTTVVNLKLKRTIALAIIKQCGLIV